MIFLKTAWNMKTFNNFTDIKFIYLSNRPALSCTDLKKTMKSSLILWMMQQKKWRRNLSNGEVIHAEVWLCQFGYYCDVLVVSCLCGLQFMCEIREHVRHETVKERTFGMLETNASIDCNAASVRAALMNYFVWLNWTLPTVNCDFFFQVRLCATLLCVIKLQYKFQHASIYYW